MVDGVGGKGDSTVQHLIPHLKGVFAKNERGYRLNAIKKALLIATNLTSIYCVYKEKIDKDSQIITIKTYYEKSTRYKCGER